MHAEEKLAALGLAIPNVPKSVANYVPWKKAGSILYLAGAVPRLNGVHTFLGKVDQECSVEDGYKAAQNCVLNHFAMIRDALGDIDRSNPMEVGIAGGSDWSCSGDWRWPLDSEDGVLLEKPHC